MKQAVTPADVEATKATLSDAVIEATNKSIVDRYKDGSATFTKSYIEKQLGDGTQVTDVLSLLLQYYRDAGWTVTTQEMPTSRRVGDVTLIFSKPKG